jgi:hypothetical protein
MIACHEILVIKTRADAQVKRIITFLLLGSFLEARALTSQPQLDHVLELVVRGTLTAYFDNSFHVTTLSSDKPASNLKFFVIVDLNIKPASVFYILVLHLLRGLLR